MAQVKVEDEEVNQDGTNMSETIFNICKLHIGIAVLGTPKGFSHVR